MSTQTLQTRKWTYEDYARLDDENRYEVIEGDLVMAPSPLTQHQRISGRLETLIRNFVEEKKSGEVFDAPFDVVLSTHNVFQPDILYISNENIGILTEKNVRGAPDLIVEILSPGTAMYDMGVKKEIYEQAGIKELWIIDPESDSALVYQNSDFGFEISQQAKKKGILKSAVLKGFQINLEDLFSG